MEKSLPRGNVKQPSLFPDVAAVTVSRSYLDSVILDSSVASAWAKVARHYIPKGSLVLDLTHRTGIMWRECADLCRVVRCDIDPTLDSVDVRSDWRRPPFRHGSFDAVVWDPPWSTEPSRTKGTKDGYAKSKYGATLLSADDLFSEWQFSRWFHLAKENALLFVRCQTLHHGGEFFDLPQRVKQESALSWTMWDEVIHVCGGIMPRYEMNMKEPKTRKVHSCFLIFRRGIGVSRT